MALVVYGSRGRVVLEPTSDLEAIRRAIDGLRKRGTVDLFHRLLVEEYEKLLQASNRDVHDDSKPTTLPIAREIADEWLAREPYASLAAGARDRRLEPGRRGRPRRLRLGRRSGCSRTPIRRAARRCRRT